MTESDPKRRLMIREMVLENFKSYAGPQRVGPFHKSFSSVVGPNGSGKSNVIDAMLFVFGRRAKQLRFNKVSELIHNSTNFRNLEYAKVTVYFQEIIDKEGDEFEVVEGTQFTVARTAHRNNQSDYYVNDKKVSTKEVTEMLKGLGIDLDNNRFLILQGEVEQISMMKPKAEDKNDTGLLEYLEDIIGTDKYVTPIEEKAKQLDEINERRQGMIQRLKISEKEKDSLEGKKNEAEDFLDKQAEMLKCKATGNQLYVKMTQEVLEKLEHSRTELDAKLVHERSKCATYEADNKEREKKFHEAEKQHTTIQKALEAAQEEFKEFERKDAKIQMELKHLKQKLKKLATKTETDTANVQKLESEVASAEADIPRCKEQVQTLTAELANQEAQLESMLESIKGEVEGYHKQLSQVRAELAPWEKKMGEVNSSINVASTERELLSRKAEDAKKRLDSALQGLAAAQQSAAAKEGQIKELEAATKRCRIQIEETKTENESQRKEEARLDASVKEAREKVAGLKSDMGSQQHQSGVVAALAAAKNKGEVSGVFGRLGDLGSIDAKYDVAVSTAVGALDYIVVETASDAQRCVEFLRRNNLGVATFLILEKQRHLLSAASEKLQPPEGAPRLYDLVKFKDERLRPAFYYAMGNTCVASDLDQASRIAYGKDNRFKRVVTLQGGLIAESGTMSGGGGRPSRGRMVLGSSAPRGMSTDAKAAAAELKQAEQQLEILQQSLMSVRDKAAASEKALRALEKQLSSLEMSLPKARMEADAEAAKAQDIKQRLDELKKATKVDAGDAARIGELDGEIRKLEASLQDLHKQTVGLEKEAAAIQAQINEAGGDKLKKQRTRVSNMRKDIDDNEADITRKGVQAKAGAKAVERLKKEMAKDAKDKEKMEGSLAANEAEVLGMEEEAMSVMERQKQADQALTAKREELEEARAERDKFQRDFGIIRQTEINIETQIDSINKTCKEESSKMAKWSAEVEAHCAKLAHVTGQTGWQVTDEEMQGKNADDCFYRVTILEAEMEKMAPDLNAIEEYRAKEADFNARMSELEEVTAERDEARKTYEGLRKRRLDEFMAGFNVVSLKLKEMYQMITLGGDAELELVDSLDPFSEGIVFSVRPPKKSWKNISNLSGGEKTLSSLSLVFALHHYKPTPLYVMDEIDAALDFKNVSIVGHYIKERTRNAQFIIISLRNNMFELADRLVGIYKTDNTTKTVTINPSHFAMPEAQQQQGVEEPGAPTGPTVAAC